MTKSNMCHTTFHTPLGKMAAVADSEFLYFLDFVDNPLLSHKIARVEIRTKLITSQNANSITDRAKQEVELYFSRQLKHFTIPIKTCGTPFQNKVWQQLQKIPYGTTASYSEIATSIGQKNTQRAIGNTNHWNNILLIIPCHRVINSSGFIGGYRGGNERKKWLLEHESH